MLTLRRLYKLGIPLDVITGEADIHVALRAAKPEVACRKHGPPSSSSGRQRAFTDVLLLEKENLARPASRWRQDIGTTEGVILSQRRGASTPALENDVLHRGSATFRSDRADGARRHDERHGPSGVMWEQILVPMFSPDDCCVCFLKANGRVDCFIGIAATNSVRTSLHTQETD